MPARGRLQESLLQKLRGAVAFYRWRHWSGSFASAQEPSNSNAKTGFLSGRAFSCRDAGCDDFAILRIVYLVPKTLVARCFLHVLKLLFLLIQLFLHLARLLLSA